MLNVDMTQRSAQILEAAIQEFIMAGEPVSSGLLYDRYDFGIKPAMIRLELDDLEDAGYLDATASFGGTRSHERRLRIFCRTTA